MLCFQMLGDGMELELDDGERMALRQNRALGTDKAGNEIFVGLSREESLDYLAYRRQSSLVMRAAGIRPDKERRLHGMALREKHERARLQIVGTMIEKENFGGTEH